MSFLRAAQPFRLQYASNLFAGHRGWKEVRRALKPAAAPTLALLGNVGSLGSPAAVAGTQAFLRFCAAEWETVLWVPGPTELASETPHLYTDRIDQLRELAAAAGDNTHVLDQSAINFDDAGVQVLGVSGWSQYPPPTNALELSQLWHFTDGGLRPFDEARIKALHSEDMDWLDLQLNSTDRPTILLSHSVPDPNLVTGSTLTDAAAKRLALDLMPMKPMRGIPNAHVVAWLSGATGCCATGTAYPWRMFLGLNSYAGGPDAPPNPNYQRDQVFEWTPPSRRARAIARMPFRPSGPLQPQPQPQPALR